MLWLGNGKGGCYLHNAKFDFNDAAIPTGVSFFVRLAERFLARDDAAGGGGANGGRRFHHEGTKDTKFSSGACRRLILLVQTSSLRLDVSVVNLVRPAKVWR